MADLLAAEIDLAEMKRQARQLGIDVNAVEAGYRAYRDKQDELLSIASRLLEGDFLVPTSSDTTSDASAIKVKEVVGGETSVVSDREMRAWLIEKGHDVPASGRLAKRWKDVYWQGQSG